MIRQICRYVIKLVTSDSNVEYQSSLFSWIIQRTADVSKLSIQVLDLDDTSVPHDEIHHLELESTPSFHEVRTVVILLPILKRARRCQKQIDVLRKSKIFVEQRVEIPWQVCDFVCRLIHCQESDWFERIPEPFSTRIVAPDLF